MAHYSQHVATRKKNQKVNATPQTQPIPGREADMVKNDAGGFAFKADNWLRLERFLILGSEGGTFYANEKKHTERNTDNLLTCIAEDGIRVVDMIVDVSEKGRALKNEHALFALAMVAAHGNAAAQKHAWASLPRVARIGTHLFMFNQFTDQHRGWGPARRNAIASWYEKKDNRNLALQMVKYQGRATIEGDSASRWTHCDLLRKAHPFSKDAVHNALYDYATHSWEPVATKEDEKPVKVVSDDSKGIILGNSDVKIIVGHEKAKTATTAAEIIALIKEYKLPHECVPSQFKSDPDVWRAMLPHTGLEALIRSLGNITSKGVLAPMSKDLEVVINKLTDAEYVKKSRLHPLKVMIATKQYAAGHGEKGSLTWTPVQQVLDALDECFYLSFGAVDPTGKKMMLCIDVSGSMSYNKVAGLSGFTCTEVAAILALATAKVEKPSDYMIMGFATEFRQMSISPKMRLDEAMKNLQMAFGGTDPTVPIRHAIDNKLHIDCFAIYSDGEGWAGQQHVQQALDEYRKKINPTAKMVNINMTANGTRLGDANDVHVLDIAGASGDLPSLISAFISMN